MSTTFHELDSTQDTIFSILKMMFLFNGCELPEGISVKIDENRKVPIYYNLVKSIFLAIDANDKFYAQFAFQLAHELTHAYVAENQVNHVLSWIIEIIACNMSFYALEFLNRSDVQEDDYFMSYIKNDYAHPHTSFNTARAIIEENINDFISNCNNIKETPLIYFLYDNKSELDIWKILQAYKAWSENYSDDLICESNAWEHFCNASKSLNEYLKTYSPDSQSNVTLFNLGEDLLNKSSTK